MPPSDDDTAATRAGGRAPEVPAAGPDAEVHFEGGYVAIRTSAAPEPREGVDEDEPYGHINYEALSFHPERLALLEDSEEDLPVTPEAWFVEERNGFDEAHCVTLVQHVSADDVLDRLKAKHRSGGSSFDDFLEEASMQQEDDDDRALVGVADLDRWALLVESNGFVATRPRRQRALSRGTTTVTLYAGINSSSRCTVTVDGEEQLTFDWMFPAEHRGTRSDVFVERMLAAGLSFEEDDDAQNEVAQLAFVENLTGVRLTVGLLNGLAWHTGVIKNR